ncbi:MAG: NAD(P)/FAD-dependent oxidoreductase [Anaerolineae bacterium]|nr:NAD(P)/FAD-dependent oxidoreductase [Anaerolineae bacterium]
MKNVIVIGGGAAGLMATGRASEMGAHVVLLEKMREAGKKILVSGKERCNLTNTAPVEKFVQHYGRNGQFLRNAYHRFFRDELLALLARYGVTTQDERGGRIFPASGQASDVRDALLRYAGAHGAEIRYLAEVQRLSVKDGAIAGVELQTGERLAADAVILATGGASWPDTGSTGEGYRMVQDAGHTLTPLRPALVPLTVRERALAKALQGVSLRNVRCTFYARQGEGKEKPLRMPYPLPPTGEMLFTHFGVSGPLILTASLAVVDALRDGKRVSLAIDLKPGMTEEEVRARLQQEFEQYAHRRLSTLLKGWLPQTLAEVLAQISGVDAGLHVHNIRAVERENLIQLLKDFRWEITGALPLVSAMVTAGGVQLKEVDPVSFESKIVRGLHIVGEVLDLAADTGGFNLQAAFSSGYLAGEHAARAEETET